MGTALGHRRPPTIPLAGSCRSRPAGSLPPLDSLSLSTLLRRHLLLVRGPPVTLPPMAASRGRNRPLRRRPGKRSRQIVVSVRRTEHDAYDAASARIGLTISAWARRTLDAALGTPRKRPVQRPSGRNGNTRPAAGEVRATSVGFHLSPAAHAAYLAEAKRQGTTQSEWVRRVLNRAANQHPRAARSPYRRRRPNLTPEDRRSTKLIVRVSRAEREAYHRGAARQELRLADWVRGQIFDAVGKAVRHRPRPMGLRDVSISIQLRATEQATICAEAARARLGMSEWVRRVLSIAAVGARTP